MNEDQPVIFLIQGDLELGAEPIYAHYLERVRLLLDEYSAEIIASGEGLASEHSTDCWQRNTLVQFPSYAAAVAFMTDPRYQALKEQHGDRAYTSQRSSFFCPRRPQTPSTLDVGLRAFEHFRHGLATGAWEGFLDLLTDDFSFWFPKGKFKGFNQGKERAREFFAFVSTVFADGLIVHLEQVTSNANTVVFEFNDEGKLRGQPYQNRVAVSFEVRGDQICSYREYFGLDG